MLWKSSDSFNVMAWEIIHSPIILHFKVLNSDYIQTLDYSQVKNHYMNIGLYPCQNDFYIFCKYWLEITVLGVIVMFLLAYASFKMIIKNDRTQTNNVY